MALTPRRALKPGRRWRGEWVVGVYNAYARRNAFSVYASQGPTQPLSGAPVAIQGERLSIVGTAVPSLAYNFSFE